MGRLSSIATVALSLVPGLASAATISSFSVEASAQMTLVGATFVGPGGGDAVGSLNIAYTLDQLDDFPQQNGNASVTTSFTNDDATGFVSASATGTAGGPFGLATADVHGRLVQTITNTSTTPITLAFNYALQLDGSISGPDAEVVGTAFVELQDFFGQVFIEVIPLYSSPPQSIAAQTTLVAGAGETVYASAYAEIFGSALVFDDIPAPVPLPGSLPLLAGAVGGFMAWRRLRSA
jgi:hypothetical protein